MLLFDRENSELIKIYELDGSAQGLPIGDFKYLDGHWYCAIKEAVNRDAFEHILKRMQLLHGFEPPYYKDGNIIVTTATGALRRAEFPVGHFVRVNEIKVDNTSIITVQSPLEGVKQITTLNTVEDILGAVEYGQKRISDESTHADPG